MTSDKKRCINLIRDFRTAMLITKGPKKEEQYHGRPMIVARADEDGKIYFITSLHSGKVDEILEDAAAVVTMQSMTSFISISGTCRVRKDEMVDELWSKGYELWFDRGREEAVVIEFKGNEAEFWNQDFKSLRFVFEAARAAIRRQSIRPTKVGEHAQLTLS